MTAASAAHAEAGVDIHRHRHSHSHSNADPEPDPDPNPESASDSESASESVSVSVSDSDPGPPSVEPHSLFSLEEAVAHQLREHEKVLRHSIRSVQMMVGCSLFTAFLRSSRTNIWILYAREFYDATADDIAWVLYGGTMFAGIAAIFYASIADYLGYDKMMVVLLCLKCVGVLLEAIGTHYVLLVVGFFLTNFAVLYVCLSYIAWILPHRHSIIYTSQFYALYWLAYLSGAMIGSLLSYYFDYQLIFWVNFVLMLVITGLSLAFIWGRQPLLEQQQLTMKFLYQEIDAQRDLDIDILARARTQTQGQAQAQKKLILQIMEEDAEDAAAEEEVIQLQRRRHRRTPTEDGNNDEDAEDNDDGGGSGAQIVEETEHAMLINNSNNSASETQSLTHSHSHSQRMHNHHTDKHKKSAEEHKKADAEDDEEEEDNHHNGHDNDNDNNNNIDNENHHRRRRPRILLNHENAALREKMEQLYIDDARFSVVINEQRNADKFSSASYFEMTSMTGYLWIMLICVVIQHGMVLCVDALLIIYYNVYIVDRFHSSVLIGAGQIVVLCLSFSAANYALPRIISIDSPQSQYSNRMKYIILLLCSITVIIMFGVIYPTTTNLDLYWIYAFVVGTVSGVLSITQEIIILEVQPKEYTGRVNGIKGFTRFFVTAHAVVIAGLLWETTYNSMFYTQAGAYCLSLLLVVVMIVTTNFYGPEEEQPMDRQITHNNGNHNSNNHEHNSS